MTNLFIGLLIGILKSTENESKISYNLSIDKL